jgi:hypothetical protein
VNGDEFFVCLFSFPTDSRQELQDLQTEGGLLRTQCACVGNCAVCHSTLNTTSRQTVQVSTVPLSNILPSRVRHDSVGWAGLPLNRYTNLNYQAGHLNWYGNFPIVCFISFNTSLLINHNTATNTPRLNLAGLQAGVLCVERVLYRTLFPISMSC